VSDLSSGLLELTAGDDMSIQSVVRCPVCHQSSNAFSEIAPTLRHLKDDYTIVRAHWVALPVATIMGTLKNYFNRVPSEATACHKHEWMRI
jgi:hypothetical protein